MLLSCKEAIVEEHFPLCFILLDGTLAQTRYSVKLHRLSKDAYHHYCSYIFAHLPLIAVAIFSRDNESISLMCCSVMGQNSSMKVHSVHFFFPKLLNFLSYRTTLILSGRNEYVGMTQKCENNSLMSLSVSLSDSFTCTKVQSKWSFGKRHRW